MLSRKPGEPGPWRSAVKSGHSLQIERLPQNYDAAESVSRHPSDASIRWSRTKRVECISDSLQRVFAGSVSLSTPFRLPEQSLQPFASGANSTGLDRAHGADPETPGLDVNPIEEALAKARRRPIHFVNPCPWLPYSSYFNWRGHSLTAPSESAGTNSG